MFGLLPTKLLSAQLFVLAISHSGNTSNPFNGLKTWLNNWAGPIRGTLYSAALVMALVVIIIALFGGQQARARMKSHLTFIAIAIILAAAIGYFVGMLAGNSKQYFTGSIVPLLQTWVPLL